MAKRLHEKMPPAPQDLDERLRLGDVINKGIEIIEQSINQSWKLKILLLLPRKLTYPLQNGGFIRKWPPFY